jgi:predicted HicB family RNase H-like nuclease
MKYKGYEAVVSFDDEAEIFHGEVVDTRDVITFQGQTASGLKKAFKESIDDYLAFCKKRGEAPEKPFSGNLVIRIDPAIHRKLTMAAKKSGCSLNALIQKRLAQS